MNTYIVAHDELIDTEDGDWDYKITTFGNLDAAKEFMKHLESLDYTKCIQIFGPPSNGGQLVIPPTPYQKWKLSRNNKWRRVKPVYPYMKPDKLRDRFA